MENLSYSSYADSGDSSPLSPEIDESQSWDEPPPPSNYKLKFLCSYGGKIQPRPHDNHLAYIGGDTKILALDRSTKFPAFVNKLAALCGGAHADADVRFKYQLPGEDLDSLVSVTNDEDLEHMMIECDRVHRASAKPARLRLFLFNLKPSPPASGVKSEGQWFVYALNSAQLPSLDVCPPSAPAAAGNPDCLSGLDEGFPAVAQTKFIEKPSPPAVLAATPAMNQQTPDLERLQMGTGQEQVIVSRKIEETNSRVPSDGEYHSQKVPETFSQIPLQMPISTPYFMERSIVTAEQPQPVYLIPTASGIYHAPALRPVTGQIGPPGYYGVQPVYSPLPLPASAALPLQQPVKLQVGYDTAGRQVYYTAAAAAFPVVAGTIADGVQGGGSGGGGGALNQDGEVVVAGSVMAPPETSSLQ